ncbi:hypothetical protein B0F90DRAFT_1622366, partial [Multifurca ochricompacta]
LPLTNRVPVTLGVMSRCPDALLCETLFDKVIPRVANKIDLSLAYVARHVYPLNLPYQPRELTLYNRPNSSEPEFGVTCMHGRDECAGNVQQLCVAKYTPVNTWWEFVMCQNYEGRDKIGRSDVALKCARTVKIDWEGGQVGRCAGLDGSGTGKEGVQLLQESIKVIESLQITKSCTIVINGEKVCVHDGIWKDCENGHEVKDFVKQIEAEYQKLNGNAMVSNK